MCLDILLFLTLISTDAPEIKRTVMFYRVVQFHRVFLHRVMDTIPNQNVVNPCQSTLKWLLVKWKHITLIQVIWLNRPNQSVSHWLKVRFTIQTEQTLWFKVACQCQTSFLVTEILDTSTLQNTQGVKKYIKHPYMHTPMTAHPVVTAAGLI